MKLAVSRRCPPLRLFLLCISLGGVAALPVRAYTTESYEWGHGTVYLESSTGIYYGKKTASAH